MMKTRGIVFSLVLVAVSMARAEDAGRTLGPIRVSVTPEVRSTYISLGKLVEDRPMQITDVHLGYDTDIVGVFGVRNWDVSSLTDRRADAHRHCLYHTEFGPYWQYDWKASENVTLKTEFTLSWTLYRGFDDDDANKTYRWYQLDQSVENPYVTPFWRVRRSIEGCDFWYYKFGVRRAFAFCGSFYVMPSVFAEGGNDRYFRRTFGENTEGDGWSEWGVSSISARLELGWKICSWATAFAYVEQYEIVGGDARDTNAASTYTCAHNDWTHGGIGIRIRF